ncbi:MAG: rod shape-determining protein RodA [Candidatus Sedimenticola endophacoides]|uniref:Peptidoglycan glycosyltransferase MrdB n=1 Tax=Candidatus Sedimenticola endophacoides TaxID=2548426 RepID=A0A657PV13_9GAMM|nr:MAG: rod shape-determining protein RodA [Candidatus Sedimenticola endophacoides]OQX35923.1 MAG: rod shape-determining protein RodA [Candidatus Sedimenticola endophacoides]OQX40739.1 MAG: rod shape-determining protein RodA [Candidatus Sedimenticola endophacoides]OQX43624.1 MAG: rod shape-determining protein RodA [Candidatus Sedimenticola endophacoides]OQX45431.1 MAG: rod shape-determining protein RodA [Candidatus Sedimenticola endophacoides]
MPHQRSGLRESNPAKAHGLLAGLHLDLPLLTGVILLCGFGLVVLFSASNQDLGQIQRQLVRLGLAFGFMITLAQIRPDTLRRWSPWLFAAALLMLAAVLAVGAIGKGAQRWLDLGLFRFQPSELMKIAMPMMIAGFLAEKRLPPSWQRLGTAGLMIAVPVVMIARQPDLGTSLLVASAGIFVLFLAGLSWRFIGGMLLTAIPSAWVLWRWGMHDYQRDRVITFLNPESDPLGTGYHIIQSKIAIGSGGLYGKGWLNGTQSHLEFLPERTTDFIFAVLSEEFGFAGVALLIVLYLFIILRGLYIAANAQDTYGRLLGGALTLVFFVYLFVNTGMVSGILPVVGVPLPLISYGGTSLVTIMAGFGILMSIQTHRKLLPT